MLRSEYVEGEDLVGREVLLCWDDDVWYDAVVIRYLPKEEKYKLVYRMDDGIEVTRLRDRRWMLMPKKSPTRKRPVLDGALIEFEWPRDNKMYKAMVYDYSDDAERLLVAYLDDNTTDCLTGGGWDFVTTSPCLIDPPAEMKQAVKRVGRADGAGNVDGDSGAAGPVRRRGPRQGVRKSPRFAEN